MARHNLATAKYVSNQQYVRFAFRCQIYHIRQLRTPQLKLNSVGSIGLVMDISVNFARTLVHYTNFNQTLVRRKILFFIIIYRMKMGLNWNRNAKWRRLAVLVSYKRKFMLSFQTVTKVTTIKRCGRPLLILLQLLLYICTI